MSDRIVQPEKALAESVSLLRRRLFRVVSYKSTLSSLIFATPVIAVSVLALRFAKPSFPLLQMALASVAAVAALFAVLLLRACRNLPSEKACVAAIDSASSAGGLMMTGAASAGWDYPEIMLPQINGHTAGRLPLALFSVLLVAAVFGLPQSWFLRASQEKRPVLATLAEKELERLEELADAGLLDAERAAEMQEWLEKIADEDASPGAVNELLESLDHIASQLSEAESAGVDAALGENEALMAAENMSDFLAEALADKGVDESLAEAFEKMKEFIAASDISEQMKSNILESAISSASSLTPEMLQQLSEAIAKSAQMSSERIEKLIKSGRMCENASSKCGGSNTNCSAAAAAALSELAKSGGKSGEAAAACLKALPGAAGEPARGPGAAELTFRDGPPPDAPGLRDQSMLPYYKPEDKDAKLQRVFFTDPQKADSPSRVTPGALEKSGDSGGKTRRGPVLPRHRQAVERYFLGDK